MSIFPFNVVVTHVPTLLLFLKHFGYRARKLALEHQIHSSKNVQWMKTACSDDCPLEAIIRHEDE